MPDPLAQSWLRSVAQDEIVHALRAVYTLIADQVEARAPACWASGRCCNFEKSGHLLYTTGLEAAFCIAHLPGPLGADALQHSASRGACAFQSANLCSVHSLKPSACRLYFCDRSAQAWQQQLTERVHAEIRSLHTRHSIPYEYAEWRALLRRFLPG